MKKFLLSIVKFNSIILAMLIPTAIYYFAYVRSNQKGDLDALGGVVISRDSMAINTKYPILDKMFYVDMYDIYSKQGGAITPQIILDEGIRYVNLGDSFSQQVELGYVNFLGANLGERIVNIRPNNAFDMALSLLNCNFFSDNKIDHVIIECVERNIVDKIYDCDIDNSAGVLALEREVARRNSKVSISTYYKQFQNWILLGLNLKPSPIRAVALSESLFSSTDKMLHFYHRDLKTLSMTDRELKRAELKLLAIKSRFDEEGISLTVMGIPDKYSIYQDWIVDPKYGRKEILEQLSSIESIRGFFYNSKQITLPMVQDGVKDVYFQNDTHWSPVACEVVGRDLAKFIKAQSAHL